MQVSKLRVSNYKSFRDSGWLEFPPGFTVIVGQNNSGKTALLEAFRLTSLKAKPHRSSSRDQGVPENPLSSVEADLLVSGRELLQCILLRQPNSPIWFPAPTSLANSNTHNKEQLYLDELLGREWISVKVTSNNGTLSNRGYPTLDFSPTPNQHRAIQVDVSLDRQTAKAGQIQNNGSDNVSQILPPVFNRTTYVFRAERLNIGRTKAMQASDLSPDGSNLAAVLMTLQSNPSRFQKFKRHVFEIFPNIKEIAVSLIEQDCEVRIWSTDTERDDLAIPLQESGTGIGQVLAILYVALNITCGLIVIDEPSTFLHPGAAKKLVQILQTYDTNQYILATHSAELISTAQPNAIFLVQWDDGESKVTKLDGNSLTNLQTILGEVGASFSDVFGYDRAIWVEGATEEICFPLILKKLGAGVTKGIVILAIKNTGDFEKKSNQRQLIWDIYTRLSSSLPLLPAAVIFSFDRENRKESEIEDLIRESKGKVRFLQRLSYENYLMSPNAIAATLSSETGKTIPSSEVLDWIKRNGGAYSSGFAWDGDISNSEWLSRVNAPKLLKDLFDQLSGINSEYRKTKHSVAITEWLLNNQPEALVPLAEYVVGLTRAG